MSGMLNHDVGNSRKLRRNNNPAALPIPITNLLKEGRRLGAAATDASRGTRGCRLQLFELHFWASGPV